MRNRNDPNRIILNAINEGVRENRGQLPAVAFIDLRMRLRVFANVTQRGGDGLEQTIAKADLLAIVSKCGAQ